MFFKQIEGKKKDTVISLAVFLCPDNPLCSLFSLMSLSWETIGKVREAEADGVLSDKLFMGKVDLLSGV